MNTIDPNHDWHFFVEVNAGIQTTLHRITKRLLVTPSARDVLRRHEQKGEMGTDSFQLRTCICKH